MPLTTARFISATQSYRPPHSNHSSPFLDSLLWTVPTLEKSLVCSSSFRHSHHLRCAPCAMPYFNISRGGERRGSPKKEKKGKKREGREKRKEKKKKKLPVCIPPHTTHAHSYVCDLHLTARQLHTAEQHAIRAAFAEQLTSDIRGWEWGCWGRNIL